MKYDQILKNDNINYAIIKGNNKIVFIKSGLGTDNAERKDKYVIMAGQLKEKYGCSVIISSNPNDKKSHAESDKQVIKNYVLENDFFSPVFLFFGNSNGCIKGLELASDFITFKKMILVNMPLMINFHKTLGYISKIPQTDIVSIYGNLDPSFSYIPFFEGKFPNVTTLKIPNADHNFKGMTDEFISLSDHLMN